MDFATKSWIVVHIAVFVFCGVHLSRRRSKLPRSDFVKQGLLLLVPVVGVLGYLFRMLENTIQRGTPGRQDEVAPFLRSFRRDRH